MLKISGFLTPNALRHLTISFLVNDCMGSSEAIKQAKPGETIDRSFG
ncbi:MAG: hypothetical protein ACFCU5_16675 [Pleurocapsa sp.]